jgi:hypothetical protein
MSSRLYSLSFVDTFANGFIALVIVFILLTSSVTRALPERTTALVIGYTVPGKDAEAGAERDEPALWVESIDSAGGKPLCQSKADGYSYDKRTVIWCGWARDELARDRFVMIYNATLETSFRLKATWTRPIGPERWHFETAGRQLDLLVEKDGAPPQITDCGLVFGERRSCTL